MRSLQHTHPHIPPHTLQTSKDSQCVPGWARTGQSEMNFSTHRATDTWISFIQKVLGSEMYIINIGQTDFSAHHVQYFNTVQFTQNTSKGTV